MYLNAANTTCGGRIRVIRHTNDYMNCGTVKTDFDPYGNEGSEFIMQHQRLTIKHVVNQGLDDPKI